MDDAGARKIGVMLSDGYTLSRTGLKALLDTQPDMAVLAETSTEVDTLRLARELTPDVLVLGSAKPRRDVLEVISGLRLQAPEVEVAVLGIYPEEHFAMDVFHAGARGFLVMDDAPETLLACVRALADRRPFISPAVSWSQVASDSPWPARPGSTLTQRERLIVRLIADGLRTPEIAARLGISRKTVETHRAAILRKLELGTLADVVRFAVRNAMTDD